MIEFRMSYWTIACLIIGTLVASLIMGFFRGSSKFNVQGKTLVLTGASEGMGLSVAKQLAAKGANIVIVSRSPAKLEKALAEVKAAASNSSTQKFHSIAADLCEPENATRVIAETKAWNNGQAPDVVWCMAGSSYPKLFVETPISKLRLQMDMNYWTAAYTAHAILQEWLAPSSTKGSQKHLIFTSSVVAFYSIAGYAPYAPSKAALKSLSDTLAQEMLLYGDDVQIHTIFPGGIASAGMETENLSKPDITHKLEESDPILSPDEVAAKSIARLENGDYLITVGFLGSAMRACAWGGSRRNNWFLDTGLTWIVSAIWGLIAWDLNGKVTAYGKKNGHPSTYPKKAA